MKPIYLCAVALLCSLASLAQPAAIAGSATVCTGSSIPLSDATPGGTWSSENSAVATVDMVGTVTGVATGSVHLTYTTGTSYATKFITVNPTPNTYTLTGVGSSCVVGGFHISLSGSNLGIHYQLFSGATAYGGVVPGTGAVIDFGAISIAGGFTAVGTDGVTGCMTTMSGMAVSPLPAV